MKMDYDDFMQTKILIIAGIVLSAIPIGLSVLNIWWLLMFIASGVMEFGIFALFDAERFFDYRMPPLKHMLKKGKYLLDGEEVYVRRTILGFPVFVRTTFEAKSMEDFIEQKINYQADRNPDVFEV